MEKYRPDNSSGSESECQPLPCGDTTSSANVGTLHHVEINVSNLQRSLEFWGWLLEYLGYEPFQNWPEGRSWRKGETYLVFVQTESHYSDVEFHRKRTGLNHLAFHADSRTQVDELTILLRAKGIPILYEDRHPHAGGPDHYAVFFEDRDRMKVEIVAP
ncbi:VOC family protein [Alicyclobacillus sp. ALC3]|nr:VOC family protein [Alicyclobacillus sp. ALC3]